MPIVNDTNTSVKEHLTDSDGLIVFGTFKGSTPSDANIFAEGCLLMKLDAASGSKTLFENTGTSASPSFDEVGSISAAELGADAVSGADKIADDAVSLEHLDDGIAPSHVVKYAGEHTTAGGSATESITVSGVVAGDIVVASLETEGASPVTLDAAAANTDAIDLTFSADPSTDHIVSYVVVKAAA